MTIQYVKDNNLLAYEYVRGSQLYNTSLPPVNGVEQSDTDYGGVYVIPKENLLGLSEFYIPQVSDEKHDTTYYELGRWVELLMKANPNALESLFIPNDKIIGEVHPAIKLFIDNRELFVTKECFNSLLGYSVSQIKKCKGYNKMCNWEKDKVTRKTPFDFCYTFKGQGSTKFLNWLNNRGLHQKYCGLVNTPNMHDVYSVFYDWGNHFENENITFDDLKNAYIGYSGYIETQYLVDFIVKFYNLELKDDLDTTLTNLEIWFDKQKPIGYKGVMGEDGESNTVRLSSVEKDVEPICHISYNETGYTKHCTDYRNYQNWVKNRNQVRYESNLNSNYDSKNVSHCVRLLHMGKELVEGKGFNVVRTWDRDFLIDIRNHKYEYEEIMSYVENLMEDVNSKIESCNLPETVDKDKINELLIKARNL